MAKNKSSNYLSSAPCGRGGEFGQPWKPLLGEFSRFQIAGIKKRFRFWLVRSHSPASECNRENSCFPAGNCTSDAERPGMRSHAEHGNEDERKLWKSADETFEIEEGLHSEIRNPKSEIGSFHINTWGWSWKNPYGYSHLFALLIYIMQIRSSSMPNVQAPCSAEKSEYRHDFWKIPETCDSKNETFNHIG